MFNTYKTLTRIVFLLNENGEVETPPGDGELCDQYNVNPLDYIGELVIGQSYIVVLDVVKKPFRKSEVVRDHVLPI